MVLLERSLRKFEHLLLNERARVRGLLAAWPDSAPEAGGFAHNHAAEAASELYDHEESVSLKMALRRRLAEVEAALGRIQDGTYGRCEACGTPIQRPRLDALPTARLRVECQERLERRMREYASSPTLVGTAAIVSHGGPPGAVNQGASWFRHNRRASRIPRTPRVLGAAANRARVALGGSA